MALHCAATLVLVPVGVAPDAAAGPGAVVAAPLAPGADVVEELQALADQHRGERAPRPGRARTRRGGGARDRRRRLGAAPRTRVSRPREAGPASGQKRR